MSRVDELPLAKLPAVRLLGYTDRLRQGFALDEPRLSIGSTLHAQAGDGLITPGVRTWALMLGETGVPRLPGGAILDDETAGLGLGVGVNPHAAAEHDRLCQCGTWRNHHGALWFGEAEATLHAAARRDGAGVFETIERAVHRAAVEPGDLVSYLASIASSAVIAFRESGQDRAHDGLLHMLGAQAVTPRLWSSAGVVYRMCAATMATMDMGPQMAEAIIGPEIDALARLDPLGMGAAASLAGMAFASVLTDDPDEFVDPHDESELLVVAHRAGNPAGMGESGQQQAYAARLGMMIAVDYRNAREGDPVPERVARLSVGEVGLAAYGLANLLAVRVRELWGP
jgi:hypothetical protein